MRAVRFQAARVRAAGGVLILRDGDDTDIDCAVEPARPLAPRAGLVDVPVEAVIARYEDEAWFPAAPESLRDHAAVRDDATWPSDPEGRRDARSCLAGLMHESYKESIHQVTFFALLALAVAEERSRSFRRMVHTVELLVTQR